MRRSILVVDDCSQNLKVLKEIFEEVEVDIYFANSGNGALKILENTELDLALLDVMMPEMDGIELCRMMKSTPVISDIPVIFLSADNSIDSKLEGFSAGAVDYISKPFVAEEVIARVKLHLSLVEAQRVRGEEAIFKMKVLSMASHELNNEISRVMINLDMGLKMVKRGDLEKGINYLQESKRDGALMGKTLQEFIAMARNDISRAEPHVTLFDLRQLLSDAINDAGKGYENADVATDFSLEHDLVISDQSFIKHIVLNLVSNALKYSPENPEVKVQVTLTGELLEIVISDNGIGIPDDQHECVFETFTRSSNVGDIKGTGVGLSLVKQFVESLDGTIDLKSEIGKGSTFTIALPVTLN